MLLSFQDIRHFDVEAADGAAGTVRDLLFDDRSADVRYVVVDTGRFLASHPVLLDPSQVDRVDTRSRRLAVRPDREALRNAPEVEADPPVSQHTEDQVRAYFGLPPVLAVHGGFPLGLGGRITGGREPNPVEAELEARTRQEQRRDPHLRSATELVGYGVEGTGGPIGTVDDVIVEADGAWTIRYFAVDTGRWLPGKRRLVAVDWLRSVSFPERTVHVELDRERVREAPDIDNTEAIDRSSIGRLYRHYGFPPYL
jgi:hypothetical protein